MRKTPLITGEFYHVYNRGTDKRAVFSDRTDLDRFFLSMKEFNTAEPIGSLYEQSFSKPFGGETSKLMRSSWDEYVAENANEDGFCEKDILLGQFKNKREYRDFAEDSLRDTIERRKSEKEVAAFLLE